MPVKQPQDRQPKTTKTFTFIAALDGDTGTFELPSFKDSMNGAQLRRVLGADDQEAVVQKMAAQLLEEKASPEALAAFDALPVDKAVEVLTGWIDHSMGK